MNKTKLAKRYYNPYNIGKRLCQDGYGISDIWSAVKQDSDMDLAYCGYINELNKEKHERTMDRKVSS